MLRILIIFFSTISCVLAYENEYREPGKALITNVKQIMKKSIKEADHVNEQEKYKNSILNRKKLISNTHPVSGKTFYELSQIKSPPVSKDNIESAFAETKDISFKEHLSIQSPVIMISFSMPDSIIMEYLQEAQKIGARLVIKGPVSNNFDDTIKKISQLVSDENYRGMSIDPTLFTRFNVNTVPTLVLPIEPIEPCDSNGCSTPRHIKATGTISIEYFLEKITRIGSDNEKEVAAQWLQVMND